MSQSKPLSKFSHKPKLKSIQSCKSFEQTFYMNSPFDQIEKEESLETNRLLGFKFNKSLGWLLLSDAYLTCKINESSEKIKQEL